MELPLVLGTMLFFMSLACNFNFVGMTYHDNALQFRSYLSLKFVGLALNGLQF